MRAEILRLDAASYTRHFIHRDERAWPETNCYVDLWIELLHAFDLDPVAMLPFTLVADFEGDQWTFCKPSHSDLYTLYGVDVQELTIWRPVLQHVVEHVAAGRLVLVEVDSFFLPDTMGVAYGRDHTKTTIAVQAIDAGARTLGYFHNAGYYTLRGDDFDGVFAAATLPPYTEFVKLEGIVRRSGAELAALSVAQLRMHVRRRPRANPITRYRERMTADLEWLSSGTLDAFHQYAFATLRQCGACGELAATYLRWLEARGEQGLEPAAAAFDRIATGAKALQFKIARVVNTRRAGDFATVLETMESAWTEAMEQLTPRYAD